MKQAPDSERSMDLGFVRPGRSERGSQTVDTILRAAMRVLIDEGAAAFTLKRVAEESRLKIGNVSRHFPRKEHLVQHLLHDILSESEELFRSGVVATNMAADEALVLIMTGTMEGTRAKGTTHLLTELWAMSNHNPFVAERMAALYQYVVTITATYVEQLNPALNKAEAEAVALFINAATEGTTVLAGYGRPWAHQLPAMKAIAAHYMVEWVRQMKPQDIHSLAS